MQSRPRGNEPRREDRGNPIVERMMRAQSPEELWEMAEELAKSIKKVNSTKVRIYLSQWKSLVSKASLLIRKGEDEKFTYTIESGLVRIRARVAYDKARDVTNAAFEKIIFKCVDDCMNQARSLSDPRKVIKFLNDYGLFLEALAAYHYAISKKEARR